MIRPGIPNRINVLCHPTSAIKKAPTSGVSTVPTFPPEKWSERAVALLFDGYQSEIREAAIGCWGLAATPLATLPAVKIPSPFDIPESINDSPRKMLPPPTSAFLLTQRDSQPRIPCKSPDTSVAAPTIAPSSGYPKPSEIIAYGIQAGILRIEHVFRR